MGKKAHFFLGGLKIPGINDILCFNNKWFVYFETLRESDNWILFYMYGFPLPPIGVEDKLRGP